MRFQNWQAAAARSLLVAAALGAASAHAFAIDIGAAGQNRVLNPNYYNNHLVGRTEALLPPRNVVLIYDWCHNTILPFSSAVTDDSLGTRSSAPIDGNESRN